MKRYLIGGEWGHDTFEIEGEDGEWVRYEDVADLLEALKLAAEAMEINDPHYFDESETAGKIRAAIAKAEGK